MDLPGYDAWKTRSPDDEYGYDGPTFVKCPTCKGACYLEPHGPVTAEYIGIEDQWPGDHAIACDHCQGRGEVCDYCGGDGGSCCQDPEDDPRDEYNPEDER